ncbi:MAG: hypothetical protein WBC59_02395 [Phycisphaerae bacterium]
METNEILDQVRARPEAAGHLAEALNLDLTISGPVKAPPPVKRGRPPKRKRGAVLRDRTLEPGGATAK